MTRQFSLIFLFIASVQGISETNGSRKCSAERLNELLDGLLRSVQYLDAHMAEFNFDALGCLHMAADQLTVLAEVLSKKNFTGKNNLLSRLDHVANLSNYVADQSSVYVQGDDPAYFKLLIGMFGRGNWKLYYPQRDVDRNLKRKPMSCKNSNALKFRDSSDNCFSEVVPHRSSQPGECNISMECFTFMTRSGYRDYELTHELLYLQALETHGCMPTLSEMGYSVSHIRSLQDVFCANVLRDAEEISSSGYPLSHQDLFLEQIGICGMYGFKDFWREDWIDRILAWQMKSGCYILLGKDYACKDDLRKSRISKRREKTMGDGCSSHMTAVALIAMSANIRFCAEAFAEVT